MTTNVEYRLASSCLLLMWLAVPVWGAEEAPGKIPDGVRWRALPLTDTPSDDLLVELSPDVKDPQFGEWLYGTPESPRMAVAVVMGPDGDFQLYVDQDRDRAVTDAERVRVRDGIVRLNVEAWQVIDDVVTNHEREVAFRRRGDRLQVATLTMPQHTMDALNGLVARQVDGNANGLFADRADLLQVDADNDQKFDPFLETLPFRPLVRVRGQRFFIKVDRFGTRLELNTTTSTGRVRMEFALPSGQGQISSFLVTLAGEDGSVYSLSGPTVTTDLPTGRYAVSDLFADITPAGGAPGWQFTFSRDGSIRDSDWFEVTADSTTEVDPVGTLELTATVEKRGSASPTLTIQPQLFTQSGLLINLCRIEGKSEYLGAQCRVAVKNKRGTTLGECQSGFA